MIQAIRLANWWPKLIYITTASTLQIVLQSAQKAGLNWMAEYLVSSDTWRPNQPGSDPYFIDPAGFAASYFANTNQTAISTYVSAFAAGYLLTLAIESVGSLNTKEIVTALSNIQTTFWYANNFTFNSQGAPTFSYTCIQVSQNTGIINTISPANLATANLVFPTPVSAPAGFYNKNITTNSRTSFLLSVTLGTIIPGLCIIFTIIAIIIIGIRKFDLILLPKQNASDNIDF